MTEQNASIVDADAARKDALRKAGQDYFESILAKAAAGKDPFVADAAERRKSRDLESVDPDMETVGLVLKGSKLYFIGTLFFAATTMRLVLAGVVTWFLSWEAETPGSVQAAVQPLRTPAIHSFLHLLPTTVALWATLDLGPLSLASIRASAVSIVLAGLQVSCLFGALVYSSVYLVLPWATLVPQLISFERDFLFDTTGASIPRTLLMAFGVSGAAVAWVAGLWPATQALFFLLLWASAEGFKATWEQAKQHSDSSSFHLGRWAGPLGEVVSAHARRQVVQEAAVQPAALQFYATAVPAAPLLLLGFLCLEGSELIQHELSVPAVSMILMSCGAWAAAGCTHSLLQEAMPAQQIARLRALAALASLVAVLFVHGVPQPAVLVAASLAVVGGGGAGLLASS